jgi:hypothetical protein
MFFAANLLILRTLLWEISKSRNLRVRMAATDHNPGLLCSACNSLEINELQDQRRFHQREWTDLACRLRITKILTGTRRAGGRNASPAPGAATPRSSHLPSHPIFSFFTI